MVYISITVLRFHVGTEIIRPGVCLVRLHGALMELKCLKFICNYSMLSFYSGNLLLLCDVISSAMETVLYVNLLVQRQS